MFGIDIKLEEDYRFIRWIIIIRSLNQVATYIFPWLQKFEARWKIVWFTVHGVTIIFNYPLSSTVNV